jgi:hypothetical protein
MRVTHLALLCALVGLLGCSFDGVCQNTAFGVGGASTELDFVECWDGQDRGVRCEPVAEGSTRVTCTCNVGGNVGASFERTEPLFMTVPPTEAELAPVNAGCGWALRPR